MVFETISHYPAIQRWSKNLADKPLTLAGLVLRTGNALRKLGHPVFVTADTNDELADNSVVVCASYYWDLDEEGEERCIELVLVTNQKTRGLLSLSQESATDFATSLVESLCHEYRHQEQYRKRAYRQENEYPSAHQDLALRRSQSYLGMPSEVDAFGLNIAVRLWLMRGAQALEHVKTPQLWSYEDSPDFYGYVLAFGLDHAVTKKLYKKISKNLLTLRRQFDK